HLQRIEDPHHRLLRPCPHHRLSQHRLRRVPADITGRLRPPRFQSRRLQPARLLSGHHDPARRPRVPRGLLRRLLCVWIPQKILILRIMRTLHYVMHISLDGYYADAANNMHWVHMDDTIGDWVDKVISTCDTALYGRVTYEMMAGFWPSVGQHPGYAASRHLRQHAEWVNAAKKIVVTKTLRNPTWHSTQVIKGDVVNAIKALKDEPGKNIVMLGSASLAQLLMSHN